MSVTREPRLIAAFVRLADTLVAEYDVVELLQQLVEDCVDLLGVAAAGLLLLDARGSARLVAATSEDVRLLELFQLQVDHGPCLDAIRTGSPVTTPDLAEAADQWPQFAPQAVELGYQQVHAMPLRWRGQTIGACNLFEARGGAELSAADLAVAQALADVATIGVLQRRSTLRHEELTTQLQTALTSRIVTEQAKGILAERGGIDMDQAFGLLRRYARRHHRTLTDLARSVTENATVRTAVLQQQT